MDELGLDFEEVADWFQHNNEHPYVLVNIPNHMIADLSSAMGVPLRRCYITDAALENAVTAHAVTHAEVLQTVLPDAGAVMSGDFGEVLTYIYQATKVLPACAVGPKKWRLKQDRTKPAPKSDVVHFVMPERPESNESDIVLCAEVKAKATAGSSNPIQDAIADCKKDRTSRLASTLVWLRERAITTNLGDVDVQMLDRFIDAVDHPPATKQFRAVAVICNDLLPRELATAPDAADPEFTLVVIGVPDLRATYTSVYESAVASVV